MDAVNQQGIKKRNICGLSGYCKAITFATILAWVLLFACGIVVGSSPFIEKINPPKPDMTLWGFVFNLFVAFLVYTPTNIALLSICTGLMGALGRGATLLDSEDEREVPEDKTNPLISGILRGFVTYLVIIAGLIVVSTPSPISAPTQEQYLRLAGFASVMSFVAGYNPKTFSLLFGVISRVFRNQPEAPGPQGEAVKKPEKNG